MKRAQKLDDLVAAFGRHVHEAHANPERIGCPDQSSLRNLANQAPLGPEVTGLLDHIRSCAPCLEDHLKRFRSA